MAVCEPGAIHIKAGDPYGDPVELSEGEVRALIERLIELADKIKD
jgi:hypothetical protein